MVTAGDAAEVTRLTRAAGTSFYYGMRILAPARRVAMYGVYAFCRAVDDIVDDTSATAGAKTAALARWHARAGAACDGHGDDAVTRVLADAVAAFGLRRADFHAVIDGMAMDAGDPIVAPDWQTLDLYVDRVACAVGRLSVRAFGDATAAADDVAAHLGRALQFTNILRDVFADAADGRLYLPREWLAEAGVPATSDAAIRSPALAFVCGRLASLASAEFARADAAMARCDPRAMRPARLMGATYAALLRAVVRAGWSDPRVRARIPRATKLLLALRYAA